MVTRQYAFTLVELSIVLVILGLLIGGVLTGQSLIRAAELRSVTTQYNNYMTATQTFRDKYFALPGDMTNAQSYWGVAHATPATCVTTASTTAATCNGDGNGQINVATGSSEPFRFWQHLANAGLIEGSYNGIASAGTYGSNNTNSPLGRISSTAWFIFSWGSYTGNANVFDGVYNNTFEFGAMGGGSDPNGAALKPEEAYNIDMKVDDGKPAVGRVTIRHDAASWTAQRCTDATASSQVSANYLLSDTSKACALWFRQQF